jgi:threonine dehydrogenase-like Zn-dependent dehydrogenase
MTTDLGRIPDTMLAWPLSGAGLENLGVDGRPARWPTPRPAPDQILVRSDAVGLCYSDIKVIRQGGSHPRLYGRDLARRPIVQGHEVTVTVVEVGEAWRDRYRPGQRFAIQADFYYRGRNLAYGYVFTGGLAQYNLLGAAALEGDEGSYIIPVPEGLGYAEVALTEPWACVEAAYVPRRRLHVKADGVLWLIGRPGLEAAYRLGTTLIGTPPRKIVATDVPAALLDQIDWPEPVRRDGLTAADYARLAQEETDGGFDDIIVLDPAAGVLDGLPKAIATGGLINLVGERPLGRAVQVDVGRVHYDYVVYVGTRGPDIGAAYGPARNRAEVRPGGVAWIIGGGGPMGRMHLQRMLEMTGGPRKVVVAETNLVRNPELVTSFGPLARSRGIELVVLNPKQMPPDDYTAALDAAHGGRGFDDIVVIVANTPAIEAALPQLAPDGLLVIFGGLARGTTAALDLSNIYLGTLQMTGSAGSTIHDQATVLRKVAAGTLSTASAVAAVGGLDAARDGMQGLMDGRFPGKMVIFPQVALFPLTALADLREAAPSVYRLLGPAGDWTREAEAEFLKLFAGGVYG